jgi:hypothetical protein
MSDHYKSTGESGKLPVNRILNAYLPVTQLNCDQSLSINFVTKPGPLGLLLYGFYRQIAPFYRQTLSSLMLHSQNFIPKSYHLTFPIFTFMILRIIE